MVEVKECGGNAHSNEVRKRYVISLIIEMVDITKQKTVYIINKP